MTTRVRFEVTGATLDELNQRARAQIKLLFEGQIHNGERFLLEVEPLVVTADGSIPLWKGEVRYER